MRFGLLVRRISGYPAGRLPADGMPGFSHDIRDAGVGERGGPHRTGSAKELVGRGQEWLQAGIRDGFNILLMCPPVVCEKVARHIPYESRRPGLFRTEHDNTALYGHPGLERPVHHDTRLPVQAAAD